MADEFIPELTLNPNSPLGSQAQAAPPKGADAPQQPASAPQDGVPDTDLDEAKLTPAQRKAVEAFAKTIDITDSNVVLQYGAASPEKRGRFLRAARWKISAPRTWARSARPGHGPGDGSLRASTPPEESAQGHHRAFSGGRPPIQLDTLKAEVCQGRDQRG